MYYREKCPIISRHGEFERNMEKGGRTVAQVTNETILTAISELSGYIKTLSADMMEVKTDIVGMKEEISSIKGNISEIKEEIFEIKEEMQKMNKKIDFTYKLTRAVDNKFTVLNADLITTRAEVLELQRTR
ncbi:hypothetical protein MHZ95_09920 [Sporosarcina sp. ACRSM]|uniref:hypothetical protein n=1 Tax=Sporosarcina sp. ACRSM TaxID=2918216 RepID=UPI001EF5BFAA|nr:hypothetical protein [Sporosarcina sp. ACRSM]MCG7335595.1 hypothetical protein [Sporosarcina sp. ACRSM]